MDDALTGHAVARVLRVYLMTVKRRCPRRTHSAAKIGRAHRIKYVDLKRRWEENQAGAAPLSG